MKIEELKALTDEELRDLKDKIDFILHERSGHAQPKLDAYTFYSLLKYKLYEELGTPLTDADKSGLALNFVKKNNKDLYKKVKESVDFLNRFLKNVLDRLPEQTEKIEWYNLFIDMASDNIKRIEIPLSLTTLLNQTEMFPIMLDKAFPSYAKSGAISIVLGKSDE